MNNFWLCGLVQSLESRRTGVGWLNLIFTRTFNVKGCIDRMVHEKIWFMKSVQYMIAFKLKLRFAGRWYSCVSAGAEAEGGE